MRRPWLACCAAIGVLSLTDGAAFAQSRDQIRIVGSSTVFPFATMVAENYGRTTQYPTPVIESTGSGGGIQLFCEGVGMQTPDIANASRRMHQTELERCRENGVEGVTEVRIGFDGIVMANASGSGRMDITPAQLWQALAKTVPVDGELKENPHRRWSDIDDGLPDKEIRVYGPPPTSGTRDAFVELVMEKGCKEFDAVRQLDEDRQSQVCAQMREDGAFVEAGENDNLIVQRLGADPDTFGIFGYSFLEQNRDRVQASSIAGVRPTFDNIASGDYPVARSLYIYVKNQHAGTVPGMKEFVGEFTSERAWGPDGYLADKGLIPLPEEQRERQREDAMALAPVEPTELAEE